MIPRLAIGCALALVGLPLLTTPAHATAVNEGHGIARPGNVWYGSYLAGGDAHYCGDPISGGATWHAPTAAGGSDYGGMRTTTTWTPRTSGVGAMTSDNVHRMAYVLGEYGSTTSNDRAAAVSYAVRRLTTAAGGAPGTAVPSVSPSIAEAGRTLLDESRTHRGPYAIPVELDLAEDAQTATVTDYRPVSATGRTMTGYSGTLTLSGPAVFDADGSRTRSAPGDGEPVLLRATGLGEVTVTARYDDLPSARLHYRVPERSNFQRILVAGRTEPVEGSAEAAMVRKTGPQVVTQTSDAVAEPGTVLTDHLTVSGLQPGRTVTVESTLFGPFEDRPSESPEPPGDAPVVGTVSTDVTGDEQGEAEATTEGLTITEPGYYVWFETIEADDVHHAWPGLFGQVSETSLVPWQPHVETQTSSAEVFVGAQITDALEVTGLRPGATVEVESTLYGPFPERPPLSELPPDGAPTVGTHVVTVTADATGSVNATTPPLTLEADGYYVWHETIAADDHHRGWIAPFGQVSETTFATTPPSASGQPPDPQGVPVLPETGIDLARGGLALGAALLLAGGSLLALRRRIGTRRS